MKIRIKITIFDIVFPTPVDVEEFSTLENFRTWFSDSITRGQHFVLTADDWELVDTRCGRFLTKDSAFGFFRIPRESYTAIVETLNEILGANWENHYEKRETLEAMYWKSYYREKAEKEASANIDPTGE